MAGEGKAPFASAWLNSAIAPAPLYKGILWANNDDAESVAFNAWFFGATPTAYTLTGDAGSYTIAGQDATFVVGFALAGDAGAYTLDGQDATFTITTAPVAYTLDGEAGAYVIAGQDATFTLSTDVVVPETRRRAGGRLVRKRYFIRGKFYWLTDDELSVLIAQELADISRREVKVAAPKAKPRVISAEAWAAVKPLARLEALAERMEEDDSDDEDELILMMV